MNEHRQISSISGFSDSGNRYQGQTANEIIADRIQRRIEKFAGQVFDAPMRARLAAEITEVAENIKNARSWKDLANA